MLETQKPKIEEVEKYNKQWFSERAFESIKKISVGVWDFTVRRK